MEAVLVSWENVQSQSGLPEGIYSEDRVKRAKNPVVLTFLPRKSQAQQHRAIQFQNHPQISCL